MSEIVKALSIGIIGGADGPTAIFVTGPDWKIVAALILAACVGGFLWLRKRRKNR